MRQSLIVGAGGKRLILSNLLTQCSEARSSVHLTRVFSTADGITKDIRAVGDRIRDLKAGKAEKKGSFYTKDHPTHSYVFH